MSYDEYHLEKDTAQRPIIAKNDVSYIIHGTDDLNLIFWNKLMES